MEHGSEIDKCYLLAGAALALKVFNSMHLLNDVDLDTEDLFTLTPEFFYESNLQVSAKDSWLARYTNFQILMGLAIASTMSRKMILNRSQVNKKIRQMLLQELTAEGYEMCRLDEDEVKPLFDRQFTYMAQLFSQSNVRQVLTKTAHTIQQQRTLSGGEIRDLLATLEL